MEFGNFQWGVLASLCGSFLGTFGGQLRIKSLFPGHGSWPLIISGWSTWLSGQVLGQVAIMLAPATVVACTQFSGSLLFNALLAPIILQEQLVCLHAVGVFFLSLGGILVTLSADQKPESYTWSELIGFLLRWQSMLLAGALLAVATFLALRAVMRRRPPQEELQRKLLLKHGLSQESDEDADDADRMDVYSFSYIFAVCGATDLLFTKFALNMLRLAAEAGAAEAEDETDKVYADPAVINAPPTGAVVSFTALMCVLHIVVLQCQVKSTYYKDSLENLPLFMGSGAMFQVLLCGSFFREFRSFSRLAAIGFISGFCCMILGMVITGVAAARIKAPKLAGGTPTPGPEDEPLDEPLSRNCLYANCKAPTARYLGTTKVSAFDVPMLQAIVHSNFVTPPRHKRKTFRSMPDLQSGKAASDWGSISAMFRWRQDLPADPSRRGLSGRVSSEPRMDLLSRG